MLMTEVDFDETVHTPLKSGGQTPIPKLNAITDFVCDVLHEKLKALKMWQNATQMKAGG